METKTTKQAARELDNLIEQVVADTQPTIIKNDRGSQVVVMPLSEFTAWQETIYLLSNPANAAHLLSSIESAQEGKFVERELIEE
ncbi:type II toxin-antitoxin system Phd/YefM family antitoxin [Pleurocapsales cyanobacterium LEGE 10410]|nr:type II toxin-antitoxin system Phd/YefM family antitoxin [Pleurocapsales cyanobacterium LEGE 10410]